MNRARIAKAGLAIAAVAVAGFLLDRGPRSPGATSADALRLLSEPRPLPDIAFSDGEGRPLRLAGFRGRMILLNVWATWCPPCRKEMPALDRLQASLGGPEFEVVALSIDRDGLPAVSLFYRQTGITQLRVYLDPSGRTQSDLGVTGIPATLLIDRQGREIGRLIGPAVWDSPALVKMIRDYLDAPVPAHTGNDHAEIPR